MADYTPNEMMTIAAARALKDDDVCFVGIGMPSAAANLARLTHAPNITLIYESGTLATKPNILPLSIGDGELCETAITTVSVPEMFRYWLQGGRIKVGFLGGAQIDKFANLNTTVVRSSLSWRKASAASSTSSISSPRLVTYRAATAAASSA
jgi:glutaconate CoA-transferase subunit B